MMPIEDQRKPRDFDDLLSEVGDYGPYQQWLLYIVIVPCSFMVAVSVTATVFQTVVPDYSCDVPGHERAGLDQHTWRNLTIPRTTAGELSKCEQFQITWRPDGDEQGQSLYYISNNTTACSSWEYDRSQFKETVATSYDWVCDKESYSTHVLSVCLAGNAIGTAVLQPMSDRSGRRIMFFVSIAIQIFFCLPTLFASNYFLHLALRFLASLAFQCNYQMPMLILLELMPPNKRTLASGVSFMAWTAGLCWDSLMGWAISDWRHLLLASNLPMAIFFAFWRVLPESPRWLLSQGRIKESASILIKIGISNGKKSIPSQSEIETELLLLYNQEQKEEKIGFKKIFHYHRVRTRTIAVLVCSAGCFLVYGCLLLSNGIIENNMSLNHFILSIFELPSNVIGYFSCTYLGRRFTMFKTFFFSALLSFIAALVDDQWTLLVLLSFLKLFMTEALYVLYVMGSEIFPTSIRSTGIGVTMVVGFSMMIASPSIMFAELGPSFPYWLMFGSTVIGCMASLLLPETLGLPLPQTMTEAENLAVGRPFWAFIHHWNQHKYTCAQDSTQHNDRKNDPEHQHLDPL